VRLLARQHDRVENFRSGLTAIEHQGLACQLFDGDVVGFGKSIV
jgi:hypothetical protein